ncbi:MAG: hypothetical protein JSR87_12130 [Proteobacteria bacterium]|nr:hypothetical protein [Pseudomonadota bacterium]MBS0572497.1 hypothetical protein [Pseudomonadota bacterium]
MTRARLLLTIAAVIVVGAATIALAYAVSGDVQPGWMAALGPLLLIATLVAHWQGRKGK